MPIKKLYLAGPMRGYPDDNYPHFNEIAAELRKLGYAVFNPAENNVVGGSFNDFMAIDLPEVCRADGVAVLLGWEKSQGAQLEVLVARKLGKAVVDAYTMQAVPDGLKPTNPKDASAVAKLDLSLFPATAIVYGATGLTEGDYKYGGYNYRAKGVSASVYLAALMRHTVKYQNGEWQDSKTRVPHLASMLCCVAILIDATECGMLNDDRPPAVDIAETIERMEKVSAHLKQLFPDGPGRYTNENQKGKTE